MFDLIVQKIKSGRILFFIIMSITFSVLPGIAQEKYF